MKCAKMRVRIFGSMTNDVRGAESRKLIGEDELRTDRDVNNFGSFDGKQI